MAKRPRRGNFDRITRLLRLLGLLQSSRGHNTQSLASICSVSRRTIFRDLDALRQAGVPLVYNEDRQVYHIPGTYYLPPTSFSPEEALAVIVLCNEFGGSAGLPFLQPAQSAAIKLENALPGRLRDELRNVSHAMHIRLHPRGQRNTDIDVYRTLINAIARHRCVRIGYQGVSEEGEISTKLKPYQLYFSRHSWYVIGRSSLHTAVRTFHLGRIKKIEQLEEEYRIPRGFNLDRYLRNAWHIIPEKGPDREVVIHFSKMVAQNVEQVIWHSSQKTRVLSDGRLEFRVKVSGLGEILWWILGYGDQAEVVRPIELRRLLAKKIQAMAKTYREKKS